MMNRRTMVLAVVLAVLMAQWGAVEAQVLTGSPLYVPGDGNGAASPNPVAVDAVPVQATGSPGPLILGTNPLTTVPAYEWWYGCSPTSGGMMVAHWDSQPGSSNLCDFDATYWWGESTTNPQGPAGMVASGEYIAGTPHADNCLADFMNTVGGGTSGDDIAPGLTSYFLWDDPATANNETCGGLLAQGEYVQFNGGDFTYEDMRSEIDAGRPVLLDMTCLTTDGDPNNPVTVLHGHSVVAYGYQDAMYTICNPYTGVNITVPGFAVRDTWDPAGSPSTAQSSWIYEDSGSYYFLFPTIDTSGVEWWPFVDKTAVNGYNWWNPGATDPAEFVWDWSVDHAVVVVPEPGTMLLLASGLGMLLRRRRAKA